MSDKRFNRVIIKEDRVVKKKNDKVLDLYNYFDSRDFDNYPKIVNVNDNYIESELIKEKDSFETIKGVEFIKTVANLHNKTIEYKDVSKNKYRTIYDKIIGNIEYLKKYYEDMITSIEDEIYMSPSHYLFARNYSCIDSSLKYASRTLKKWFKMVENKSKERVCVIHNNLSLNHFIKGDKNYLTSFDNYLVDTPVLDLYKFYKKEGFKLDFSYLLKKYNEDFNLSDEEKVLLNVLISMPPKIEEVDDEYLNCINIRNTINYIYNGINIINENK